MKRLFASLLVVLVGAFVALAQSLDDEYVQIFRLIQEADTLSSTSPSQALAKYLDAQTALDRLHKGSPDWNTRIVNYRLNYLASRISALSSNSSVRSVVPANTNVQNVVNVAPAGGQAANWQVQVDGLKEQLRQMQSDKSLLEAKLKEALALRPAEADPGELAKAEQRIKELQKQNELLRVVRDNPPSTPAIDPKVQEQSRQALAEAQRQFDAQTARLSKLTLEKEALEKSLKSSNAETAAMANLRIENQVLKKKLAETPANVPASVPVQDNSRASADARAQIAQLQTEKESLRLEKVALENRIKQLSVAPKTNDAQPGTGTAAADNARLKQVELERDELQKRLDEATRQLYGRKAKGAAGRVQDLETQLAMARARVEIVEARAVPYSAEELQLLKSPPARLAEGDSKSGKKSIRELPVGAKALVDEAQRCFAAKQYDKAEAAYLQVLQQDPKNVPTLANLAAIQAEADHLDKAETNIKQALSLDPDDPYSLYILGILRFRQTKYDQALDALSRSAKLDPQNAEVQNYLGLTLSEKGMRVPAEAALRRAIQLQPGYAGAHYNLAVVYATQQPPATELAKWHYQKAIAAGHPRNADLEKRFEARQ